MKLRKLVLVCTVLCAILVLHFTAISSAQADGEYLDLVIDEGVVVPWDISNLMPGVSGVAYVNVRNAGNIDGYISVWIDGIIDMEGENPEAETGNIKEPGELSQYLTLNISGERVAPYAASPDFDLPAALNEFPQSSNQPLQLDDQPLKAGETIQLQWQWAIPPQTTNVIQGDSVSFNINYLLTQYILVEKPSATIPPAYGGGIYYWPKAITDTDVEAPEQRSTDIDTTDDNKITKEYRSPDGKLTIIVPGNTRVISAGNEELAYINITLSYRMLPIPENNVLLSPIYDVAVFTPKGLCEYPQLDKPVTIIVDFDNDKLPEQFLSIYLACYKLNSSWSKLTEVREINHAEGKFTVETTQLSLIAVFAEMAADDEYREIISPPTRDSIISDSSAPQSGTGIKRVSPARGTTIQGIISQVSLAIAGGGTLAMIVLAYIERKRRDSKHAAEG